MHDNYISWRDNRDKTICDATLNDGRVVHVYNQPFTWAHGLSVYWPAVTDDDVPGFVIDGKALCFAPLDGKPVTFIDFTGDIAWLDMLRNIFYGELENSAPVCSEGIECAVCGKPGAKMSHMPIQTYESHIQITFHEHIGMECGDQEVPMCRSCAIDIAKVHIGKADREELQFHV